MYDAVVIGAGPGGYVAAIRIAQLGGKACVVEKKELGGVCTNVGCIPTKALVEVAHTIKKIKAGPRLGIAASYDTDFSKVMGYKTRVVRASVLGITNLLKSYGVDVIRAEAKIESPHKVIAGDQALETKNIIIATGSTPIVLPGITIGEHVVTSDEIFSLQEMPKELIIIGGGVIGLEFATIFSTLGTKVTVIEMMPSVIGMMDADVVEELTKQMRRNDITILTNHKFTEIRENTVTVQNLESNDIFTVTADRILFAIGRRASFNREEMDRLGVAYDRKGITIDEHMRTSVPGIYAIGDVTGRWQLAHVASAQGEAAAECIMGEDRAVDYVVPSCIFTIPEIASVGKTEKEMPGATIGKFPFAANGKARTMSEIEGFVKVIAKDGKLVGVHIIGPHASDLIEEAVVAMRNGLSLHQILETIHPHPTLCEAFKGAVEDALNQAVDLPKKDIAAQGNRE